MKRAAWLVSLVLLCGQALAREQNCAPHFVDGAAPRLLEPRWEERAALLCFEAFAVLHSGQTRTALWSAEYLSAERLQQARAIRRIDAYHAEDRLPRAQRAELEDYQRSGFDRGHLTPSADMPTRQAQEESFSLANIVPQDRNNNQNLWASIEERVRGLTRQRGELYIITGPLFEDETIERINRRVRVPSHLYKAVYDPARREGGAYIAPNRAGDAYEIVSLAELERRSGIRLFPTLSDAVKEKPPQLPPPRKSRQRDTPREPIEPREPREPREPKDEDALRSVATRLRELLREVLQ